LKVAHCLRCIFKKRRHKRLFEKVVEMTRAQKHIDNICDCGDNDRSIFFQEPGGDTIRIRLLIKILENSYSEVSLKAKIWRSYRW